MLSTSWHSVSFQVLGVKTSNQNEDLLNIPTHEYRTVMLSRIVGNLQTKLRCATTQKSGFNATADPTAIFSGTSTYNCHTYETVNPIPRVPKSSTDLCLCVMRPSRNGEATPLNFTYATVEQIPPAYFFSELLCDHIFFHFQYFGKYFVS